MARRWRIFVSYRVSDSEDAAGRLADHVRKSFGPDQVFSDVDSISAGDNFEDALQTALSATAVLLAVIGPGWVDAKDERGKRRLSNPTDWVRREIEEAFREPGVRVIPILVRNAEMPSVDQLPESIWPLTKRQAIALSRQRWEADVSSLISQLRRFVPTEPNGDTATSATDATPRALRRTPLSRSVGIAVLVAAVAAGGYWLFNRPEAPNDMAATRDDLAIPIGLQVTTVPDSVKMASGEYHEVDYVFKETRGASGIVNAEDYQVLAEDGETLVARTQPGGLVGGEIAIKAFGERTYRNNIFMPPAVTQKALARGSRFVLLRHTFHGVDQNKNRFQGVAILTITIRK